MARWALIAAAATVIEADAIRKHRGTFSELTATTFRVQHPVGRAAFLAALTMAYVAYGVHIVRWRFPNVTTSVPVGPPSSR